MPHTLSEQSVLSEPTEQSSDPGLFVAGKTYTRQDVYEIMRVPDEKRRGNWETGYNRWGNDLFVFCTVGSAATDGYDYNNGWEGETFRWFAKEGTRLDQPQIQWILNQAERIFIFTRPAIRNPFTFEGFGKALSWEDQTPVLIRWSISRSQASEFQPTESKLAEVFIEGGVSLTPVNIYERNPKARKACVEHYGYDCSVCGFNFSSRFGPIGDHFIHVHHIVDLAAMSGEYEVDPIDDLRPVCPNCHAMLHTQTPAMTIEALKVLLKAHQLSV